MPGDGNYTPELGVTTVLGLSGQRTLSSNTLTTCPFYSPVATKELWEGNFVVAMIKKKRLISSLFYNLLM